MNEHAGESNFVDSVDCEIANWTLCMSDPGQLQPAVPNPALQLERSRVPSPDLSRALYIAVGAHSCWTDRFGWSYRDWQRWVEREEVALWIATVSGTPAGFFEIEAQGAGATEITLIGLLPQFHSRGLGASLLSECSRVAWRRGMDWGIGTGRSSHVFLQTSSLDHRHALPNYISRGYEIVKAERLTKSVPNPQYIPWRLQEDPRNRVNSC